MFFYFDPNDDRYCHICPEKGPQLHAVHEVPNDDRYCHVCPEKGPQLHEVHEVPALFHVAKSHMSYSLHTLWSDGLALVYSSVFVIMLHSVLRVSVHIQCTDSHLEILTLPLERLEL